MKVSIVGSGYVGVVTGIGFAELGHEVIFIDVDECKVSSINSAKPPIYERRLEDLMQRNRGKYYATCDYDVVNRSNVTFICVGTPSKEDGSIDLRFVEMASREIGRVLAKKDDFHVVVVKSTVIPGTTEGVVKSVIEKESGKEAFKDFGLAMNPEFLREGSAIDDFFNPDRIVIGVRDERTKSILEELYKSFKCPKLYTDIKTAEMIKYVSNAFLATKISFANEIGNICKKLGIDVYEVFKGVGLDHRINPNFFKAGIGFGGSCFHPDEIVFTDFGEGIEILTFKEFFKKFSRCKNAKVLSFNGNGICLEDVECSTVRNYDGSIIEIKTSMGRSIRVTADHPVVVFENGKLKLKQACDVKINDLLVLPCYSALSTKITEMDLSLIAKDYELLGATLVHSEEYKMLFSEIRGLISNRYKYDVKYRGTVRAKDITNTQYIPKGAVLFAAKNRSTVPSKITIDKDFVRLLGYYVAEGCITGDIGVVGEGIMFCFGKHEREYIEDVKRILRRLGIKFMERISGNSYSIIVSSKILSHLFKVIGVGTNSYDASLPKFLFYLPDDLKWEFIKGLIRGDGSVKITNGKHVFVSYATVSRKLAEGLVVLLQSLGIIASIRSKFMNKNKVPAYIIRISGKRQVEKLLPLFGEKSLKYIKLINNYNRNISSIGYKMKNGFALVKVKDLKFIKYHGEVYSLEVKNGLIISTNGLLMHNCFPKDVKALIRKAEELGEDPRVLKAVIEVNEKQPLKLIELLKKHIPNLRDRKIGILGLAFKPNTDDIRESRAIPMVEALLKEGARVIAYDPKAMNNFAKIFPQIEYARSAHEVIDKSDAILIVTEWREFEELNYKGKIVIDGRRIEKAMKDAKIYEGVCW